MKELAEVRYGDVLDFFDYRGLGIIQYIRYLILDCYIVDGLNPNAMWLSKTLNEYGYTIPREFRHFKKEYFQECGFGWDDEEDETESDEYETKPEEMAGEFATEGSDDDY